MRARTALGTMLAMGLLWGCSSSSGMGGNPGTTGTSSGTSSGTSTTGSGTSTGGTLSVVTLTTDSDCTISTPTEWPAAIYVINCGNYLEVDAALTIDKGTIVKFDAGNYVNVSASGTLIATGTAADPIVFTSIKDDSWGGDTNGDGNATSPAPGDWVGIRLNGTNSSSFDYTGFYYSGGSSAALTGSSAGTVSVTNSVFAHNQPTTAAITQPPALDLSNAPSGTVVTGNTFYDNTVPLAINGLFSIDDSNSFDNSAADPSNPQPNQYNGIVFNTGPNIDGNVSWGATKVPFVVYSSYLQIDSTGSLTLSDGVIVKFGAGAYMAVAGTIGSVGTNGISFTSLKDDARGGDTNGDGSATSPASGDWNGVRLESSTGANFTKTSFTYAGGGDAAALDEGNSTATVKNCVFAHDQTTTAAISSPGALNAPSAPPANAITGNLFYDDTVPLQINSTTSMDDSNSFDNSAADPGNAQPSLYNGIVVNTGPDLEGAVTWAATKVPFVIPTYLVVDSAATLTLGNDVILKFAPAANAGIQINEGGAINYGTTGDIFTSLRDSSRGGATNGNDPTPPADGDWWGITAPGDSSLGSTTAPLTCEEPMTEYYEVCPGG
ncbi:MAG TPA: hypothetical protein VEK07_18960 [Polyangiaceae bacterium]|nr:hypothetical protein [Polyangiaceae bacterium]